MTAFLLEADIACWTPVVKVEPEKQPQITQVVKGTGKLDGYQPTAFTFLPAPIAPIGRAVVSKAIGSGFDPQ